MVATLPYIKSDNEDLKVLSTEVWYAIASELKDKVHFFIFIIITRRVQLTN
jgi:hypothetical protein